MWDIIRWNCSGDIHRYHTEESMCDSAVYEIAYLFVIQIKICTEFRDIVREAKAGVSGSWPEAVYLMRPSVQCPGILHNFFTAQIFQFSIPLWIGLRTLCFGSAWQFLLSIVIRMRQSLKIIESPSSPWINWRSAAEWATLRLWHLCHRTNPD